MGECVWVLCKHYQVFTEVISTVGYWCMGMRERDHAKVTEGWLHICKHLNRCVHVYMHTCKYTVFSYAFY